MRFAPTSTIQVASFALVASLVGCSDPPSPIRITPGDGGVDVSPTPDATGTDTPAGTDGTPMMDTPVVPDAPSPDRAPVDVQPTDVPVGQCGSITADVLAHVNMMSTMGWGALNRSRSMMMYGCAGAAGSTRPQDCLSMVPEADDSNIGGDRSVITGAHLRLLYTATTRSNFWTRSSADGRFVGRGTRVHDLTRNAEISATGAQYDPAFFPDNSGFIYQPGGRMCPMSALTMGMPTSIAITGSASPCVGSSVGLYEHLAASLGGDDYWSSSAGSAAWDDGGHSATLTETHRNETWGMTASTTLSLMANTGAGYSFVASRSVNTPMQGDAVISPSGRLLLTRFVDSSQEYQGYVLNRLDASHTGSAIMVSAREIARYCTVGAKPAFSFDERWIAYHHYVGGGAAVDADAMEMGFADSNDPGFDEYTTRGASNIYLLDLLTGTRIRVTNMAPGQYALYPHFRSDGWMYFLVRTLGTQTEHVIASDAALLMR